MKLITLLALLSVTSLAQDQTRGERFLNEAARKLSTTQQGPPPQGGQQSGQ